MMRPVLGKTGRSIWFLLLADGDPGKEVPIATPQAANGMLAVVVDLGVFVAA